MATLRSDLSAQIHPHRSEVVPDLGHAGNCRYKWPPPPAGLEYRWSFRAGVGVLGSADDGVKPH